MLEFLRNAECRIFLFLSCQSKTSRLTRDTSVRTANESEISEILAEGHSATNRDAAWAAFDNSMKIFFNDGNATRLGRSLRGYCWFRATTNVAKRTDHSCRLCYFACVRVRACVYKRPCKVRAIRYLLVSLLTSRRVRWSFIKVNSIKCSPEREPFPKVKLLCDCRRKIYVSIYN